MSRTRFLSLAAVVCIVSLLSPCVGVKNLYDETRWTKIHWARWKLPYPQGLGSEDASALLAAYPKLSEAEQSSLDGPHGRVPAAELARNALMLGLEGFVDEDMIPAAAAALQCVTCHAMVISAWQRVAADVLLHAFDEEDSKAWTELVDLTRVRVYMQDACRREVTRTVLLRNTVVKIEGSTQLGQDLIFVVIRPRKAGSAGTTVNTGSLNLDGGDEEEVSSSSSSSSSSGGGDGGGTSMPKSEAQEAPTYAERSAVNMACKKLLQEPAGSAVANAIAAGALKFKHQVLALLQDHGMLGQTGDGSEDDGEFGALEGVSHGSGQQGGSNDATDGQASQAQASAAAMLRRLVVESRPDGLHVRTRRWEEEEGDDYEEEDARCVDLHPMCETWADDGECEANPGYMVGDALHQGHCLRACGMCSPTHASNEVVDGEEDANGGSSIDPSFVTQLQALLNLRITLLKGEACVKGSKSCISAHGTTSRGAGLVLGSSGGLSKLTPDSSAELGASSEQPSQKGFPGGFVLGKPSYGRPLVVPLSIKEKGQLYLNQTVRTHQQRFEQKQEQRQQQQQQGGGEPSGVGHEGESGQQEQQGLGQTELQGQVDKVLSKELGSKLILLPAEFFVFEYLYKNHTRHYHEEVPKKGSKQQPAPKPDLRGQRDEALRQLEVQQQQIEMQQQQLSSLEQHINQLEGNLDRAQQQIADSQVRTAALEQREADCQTYIDQLENECMRVRKLYKASAALADARQEQLEIREQDWVDKEDLLDYIAAMDLEWKKLDLEHRREQQQQAAAAALEKEHQKSAIYQQQLEAAGRKLEHCKELRAAAQRDLRQHKARFNNEEMAKQISLLERHAVSTNVLRRPAVAGWDKQLPGPAAAGEAAAPTSVSAEGAVYTETQRCAKEQQHIGQQLQEGLRTMSTAGTCMAC